MYSVCDDDDNDGGDNSDEDNDEGEQLDYEEMVTQTKRLDQAEHLKSLSSSLSATTRSGASWIMQRLRGLGADSRGNRRLHVLKVRL